MSYYKGIKGFKPTKKLVLSEFVNELKKRKIPEYISKALFAKIDTRNSMCIC